MSDDGVRLDDLVDRALANATIEAMCRPEHATLGFAVSGDGALIIREKRDGRVLREWECAPLAAVQLVRRLDRQLSEIWWQRRVAVQAATAREPKWQICKLTPEGNLAGRRGLGCRRHRGHDGEHDNGKRRYSAVCRHIGMHYHDGRPVEPTCPWCRAPLAQIR